MKSLIISGTILCLHLIGFAQQNQESTGMWKQDEIMEFMQEAAQDGMTEVALGKLAQRQASSEQVREFGQLMEDDHSRANSKLKRIARDMEVEIPEMLDDKHRNHIDDLMDETGKDFDEEYMEMMVKDHKEDIRQFEKAQKRLPDGKLKDWVSDTLPVLRQHLEKAQTLEDLTD